MTASRVFALDIAAAQAQQSTILLQGAKLGTAFAILNRGPDTYFLTTAHLVDQDGYEADAKLPVGERKPDSTWLTLYDPEDGSPHDGSIVGADFATDIMVVKARGFAHRFRALCLAAHAPNGIPFLVSSFQDAIFDNVPSGRAFAASRYTVSGLTTFPLVPDSPYFQYSTPEEMGYSGSPIIDKDTGAVFGIAQGAPLVYDPETGQMKPSRTMNYGVPIQAIRQFLDSLQPSDPALFNLPVIDGDDRSDLLPNLTLRGNRLRLMVFDNPLDPSDAHRLNSVYGWYDGAIRRVLKRRFRQVDSSAMVDPETAVYPVNSDIRRIKNLCLMSNLQPAVGVIGLRRTYSGDPGLRTLESRVGLISCSGHLIDSTDIASTTMNGGGPTSDQIQLYASHLDAALTSLGGTDGTRLRNFAADGLPLGDAERRGFYRVVHTGTVTALSYSWADGEAADYSNLFVDTPVASIAVLSPEALQTLTSSALDSVLSDVGGDVAVQYGDSSPTAAPMPRPELRAADRCTYFWRMSQKDGNNGIPPDLERPEVL
jgi:hypothetical protein